MDKALFERTFDIKQDTFRNIVSLKKSQDLFDDLLPELSWVARDAEARVKAEPSAGIISRGFHYTTAISYPFSTEPFLKTRYGDGSYGVWYGSLDWQTTVYETAYHSLKMELDIIDQFEMVARERAIYLVHCEALLCDFRGKEKIYPQLVAPNYEYTQQIGQRLVREGHPGLLAPSARCQGDNIVVFNEKVLNTPRVSCYLKYEINPKQKTVMVYKSGEKPWLLSGLVV